jgi:RNA polymerase sigma-70 factor (ECF subfamily)
LSKDGELWEGIRRGDPEAFGAVYRAYAPGLQGFLRQFLGDVQAAEDVTQETFAAIWQRPNGFDPSRGSLRSYLFGAGRKRAAEWWRRKRPESDEMFAPDVDAVAETQPLIGDAFGRLAADQRSLLWLREVEGHSYEELAATLEIPVGTVGSRLSAAREALRKIWYAEHKTRGRA